MTQTQTATPSNPTGAQAKPTDGGADKAPGTTERLFGKPKGNPPASTEKTPPQEKTPASPAPKTEAEKLYLDLDQMREHRLRYKVDGAEVEWSLGDIVRDHQLGKHRENKARELAEKEKFLKQMEDRLKEMVSKPPEQASAVKPEEESLLKGDPLVEKMFKELEGVKEQNLKLQAELQPVRYQRNIENLDSYCRENGYGEDFKKYVPRIEEYIRALPPEKQAQADVAESWVTRYLVLKNQELQKAKTEAASKAGARAQTPEPPAIESGSGTSSGLVDDWQARYDAAYKRAIETGADDAWTLVMRLKSERSRVSG